MSSQNLNQQTAVSDNFIIRHPRIFGSIFSVLSLIFWGPNFYYLVLGVVLLAIISKISKQKLIAEIVEGFVIGFIILAILGFVIGMMGAGLANIIY
jgi:hypothetical protein